MCSTTLSEHVAKLAKIAKPLPGSPAVFNSGHVVLLRAIGWVYVVFETSTKLRAPGCRTSGQRARWMLNAWLRLAALCSRGMHDQQAQRKWL